MRRAMETADVNNFDFVNTIINAKNPEGEKCIVDFSNHVLIEKNNIFNIQEVYDNKGFIFMICDNNKLYSLWLFAMSLEELDFDIEEFRNENQKLKVNIEPSNSIIKFVDEAHWIFNPEKENVYVLFEDGTYDNYIEEYVYDGSTYSDVYNDVVCR